ncbi:MAG: sigma-70 family RNA polymerase sigma factor [Proteobacteria bacterium]|nr:sigma-70 family RNA polymerase sigma factor [Pseudomonadota bacterium]
MLQSVATGGQSGGSHPHTDADLLAASVRKDQRAFALLVERHFALVYRVVWRQMNGHADAEDVAQEAFLRLWKNPGQVREAGALKGWLLRVASNLVTDRFRKAPAETLGDDDVFVDGRDNAEEALGRRQVATAIDDAIAQLPERQRLALTLVHFEQLSNAAAAAVLEVSVDALESLLARARRTLKEKLNPQKQLLLAGLAAEGR